MVKIKCGDRIFDKIEAVIFDKDGTLEDSSNFWREIGQKRVRLLDAQIPGIGEPLLMAFGIEKERLNPRGLMAVGSRQENLIAAAAYIAETGRGWFEALTIARNAFLEADKYALNSTITSQLFPGTLDAIELLANAGVKLAIVSAATTQEVESFVRQHKIETYIHLSMGSDGTLSKPNPALYLEVCQSLKVDPTCTLSIGDSQGDITMAKAAKAAGAVGICWDRGQEKSLALADVIISSFDELTISR